MALNTALVESFDHRTIGDEPVDTQGLPLEDGFLSLEVPVVTTHAPGDFDDRLRSIGAGHGRSYVLNRSWVEKEQKFPQFWTDQYGNFFGELVTKGNNFSKFEMIRSATAPSGYIPYGLQEGDALLRVLRSSNLLRQGGVDTEWIVRVQEPKKLAGQSSAEGGSVTELVTPAEFKSLLIRQKLAELAMAEVDIQQVAGEESEEKLSESEIRKITEAIMGMDFFVTLRALATPYRVSDLIKDNSSNEIESLDYETLYNVFETYNQLAKLREADFMELKLPTSLSLECSPEERLRNINLYFNEVLPKLIGWNMARFHEQTLVHVFPHAGNITALGGLVDLDSVRGEPLGLGDEPIAIEDMVQDLSYAAADTPLQFIFMLLNRLNHPDESPGKKLDLEVSLEVIIGRMRNFINNLHTTYFEVRGIKTGSHETKKELAVMVAELMMTEIWLGANNYAVEQSEPYIGYFIRKKARELCKVQLTIPAADIASSLYMDGIFDGEEMFLQGNGVFDISNGPPTDEQLKLGMREYCGGNQEGVALVSEDTFEEILYSTFELFRLDQFSSYFDEMGTEMGTMLKGTILEDLDQGDFIALIIFHSKEIIREHIHNVILPEPDEVWDLMCRAYRNFEEKKSKGEEVTAAEAIVYFRQ